ncbi:MAG TPA: DUF802 domain-containing protein [Burkholderiaceae bacterium]|nr:DUF802 domain-containing protein [Burkholderiaceae bacterium]
MNRNLGLAAFVVGLGVVAWVAYGYLGTHALALTVTLLIGAFYLMGAAELLRFRQATASLQVALAALPAQLPRLGDWLATLHPSLQNAVRLRIEGERVGLPGPSITPYLVGLLVLLGMLGTFLGMVVTLNGAVMALESTTDLPTIRAALAAPVKGLGLAFGTSVAGVAASAMLGLVSVLCRRERLQVAQGLDSRIATSLRHFSRAHQREQTLESLQQQARVMPEVLEKMQAMLAQMERQHEGLGERLLAGQERFYQQAQGAYGELASSVGQSLKDSLGEAARVAGATIEPAVQATMAGIGRETSVFQDKLAVAVTRQLDALASRFDTTVTTVADGWTSALERHQGSSEALTADLQRSLANFSETFEQRAASLLASVDERQLAVHKEMQLAMSAQARQASDLHVQIADTAGRQLGGVAERLGSTAMAMAQSWRETVAAMQTEMAAADQGRLAAWTGSLETMAQSLQEQWQRASAQSLAQQQQICQTLERTAHTVQTQAEQHARDTIGEMSRLITTASEAPRAAAEVVGALRQQLSDSMVRDKDMLQERSRIMATLGSLLETVNQAATEQRSAIDALVSSSTAMLQQAGSQFGQKIASESGRVASVAAEVAASAVEMASMGEAFGVAVQMFSESNQALTTHLQRIEVALGKSTTRSDEQLAYYVAQAREIVDLSISSQKQIVDDLQRLAIRQSPLRSEVA